MQSPDLFFLATIIFAVVVIFYAYRRKKIDFSALAASGVVGAVALLTVGVYWLYLILAFFIIGNLVTKYRYSAKESLGVAEGVRTYKNVFGNGGAATVFAILYPLTGWNPVLLLGFIGSMATATADTFATEVGGAHDREPRLITNLRKTKAGTSGAISLPGSIGALIGAATISLIPLLFTVELDKTLIFFTGTISGFIGCHVDSLIGATLERTRGNTHITNFLGTLSGGITAILLYLLLKSVFY
ncbi:MAG: DUF92 domain-containing protein [Candidatus Altiarchaeota archaeon]|nr:DUF92 domain-containing protein [Candidatus Altiarchaeota archaeon]